MKQHFCFWLLVTSAYGLTTESYTVGTEDRGVVDEDPVTPPTILVPPLYISRVEETPARDDIVLTLGLSVALEYKINVTQNETYTEINVFRDNGSAVNSVGSHTTSLS